jgi:pseudomonalisin/xanthomonalisin
MHVENFLAVSVAPLQSNYWQITTFRKMLPPLRFFATAAIALHAGSLHAEAGWVATKTQAFDTRTAIVQRRAADTEMLHVVVALKLRDKSTLDSIVAQPGGTRAPSGLDPDVIKSRFAPTPEQRDAVILYLRNAGFTNVRATANGLLVTATGSAAAAQRAFHTVLAHVQYGSRSGIANLSPAMVPAELGDTVLSVLGLNTLFRAHSLAVPSRPATGCGGRLQCDVTVFPGAFDPPTLAAVYNAGSLPTGSGITAGIIVDGNVAQPVSDLRVFESVHGYAPLTPKLVLAGPAGSDTSSTTEYDIDSQTILGVAGGSLANLIFFVATTLNDDDLTLAINAALSYPAAKTINISLDLCETEEVSDGTVAADDQIFELAVAQGQTFAVASGDQGSAECTGPGQSYPASSRYVIAVGGTTLKASGNTYVSETAWSGSGGGPSVIESKPPWQDHFVGGSTRGVPDLAFDGDPATGVMLIVGGSYSSSTWGGTSLAAPILTGLMSRLQAAQKNRLPFPVEQFYGFPDAIRPLTYHDVTSGSNGAYKATAGWDYVTGFGSLNTAVTNHYLGTPPLAGVVTYLLGNQLRFSEGK